MEHDSEAWLWHPWIPWIFLVKNDRALRRPRIVMCSGSVMYIYICMKYIYVNILGATPSAAPFGFAGSPFGGLGASFLTFWEPFWHLGITLGCYLGTSGAPWEAILGTRDHLGEPWEQQDGNEVARHRILVDFRMISGPVLLLLVSLCFEFSR